MSVWSPSERSRLSRRDSSEAIEVVSTVRVAAVRVVVEPLVAAPVFAAHDRQVRTELPLGVEELREFAERHPVSHGERVEPDEAGCAGLNRTLEARAGDGINAIQHD